MKHPSPLCSTAATRHGSATRWSPSGKPGSRPVPTGFGPGAAAPTRSSPCIHASKGHGQTGVDSGRGSVGRVRQHRSFQASRRARIVPRAGPDQGWLKAGVIENGTFAPTEQGSPQGGVISPLLMNVVLHGLEEAAGVRYRDTGGKRGGTPVLVRYADEWSAAATPGSRPSRSRRGWPHGWLRGV